MNVQVLTKGGTWSPLTQGFVPLIDMMRKDNASMLELESAGMNNMNFDMSNWWWIIVIIVIVVLLIVGVVFWAKKGGEEKYEREMKSEEQPYRSSMKKKSSRKEMNNSSSSGSPMMENSRSNEYSTRNDAAYNVASFTRRSGFSPARMTSMN